MAANYTGTRITYSVHVINHKTVINMHSNDVILPVLTSRHSCHAHNEADKMPVTACNASDWD